MKSKEARGGDLHDRMRFEALTKSQLCPYSLSDFSEAFPLSLLLPCTSLALCYDPFLLRSIGGWEQRCSALPRCTCEAAVVCSPQTKAKARRHLVERGGRSGQPSPDTVPENCCSAKATFALRAEDENYTRCSKDSVIHSQMGAGETALGVL